MSVADIFASAFMLLGTLMFLVTAIGMLRSRDALTRVNILAPALGAGVPLILIGALIHEIDQNGFSLVTLISVLISIAAMLMVASIASNALARAVYRSGGVLDEHTRFNDLAD